MNVTANLLYTVAEFPDVEKKICAEIQNLVRAKRRSSFLSLMSAFLEGSEGGRGAFGCSAWRAEVSRSGYQRNDEAVSGIRERERKGKKRKGDGSEKPKLREEGRGQEAK